MSTIPPDHLAYLRRRPFVFRCSMAIFPEEELNALAELGNWLEALAEGAIEPMTKEQEHFLQVHREKAEPETVHERAWVRLKGRREFERENQTAPPESPIDNYGIVEWDADRCWW